MINKNVILTGFYEKVNTFFCVFMIMREEILNYLIVKNLEDKSFNAHVHQKVKLAYILAKKQYEKLTEEQKQKILEDEKNDRINKKK